MGRLACILSIAGIVALCGCAGHQHADKTPAETRTAAHTSFETAEEPPLKPQTYYAAGQLSETQGRYDNAIRQYKQALKTDPHHLPSLYRLGVVYAHLKQYDQAIDIWKRYVAETKQDATAYANLALAQSASGRLAEAEASFKSGIARDPNNASCRVNYGLLLAQEGRADEALTQFQAVLTPAQAHYNLGSVYEQQHKFDQARAEYQTALKLDPSFTAARKRLQTLP